MIEDDFRGFKTQIQKEVEKIMADWKPKEDNYVFKIRERDFDEDDESKLDELEKESLSNAKKL